MEDNEILENTQDVAQDVTTDNSEVETKEPVEETDNSEEVETKEPEQTSSKFNSIEEATKGYSELEKKLGQQSNELGELRKIKELYEKSQEEQKAQELKQAQSKGFESVEQYQMNQQEVNFIADEYAKHISEVDFPEEMAKLLDTYKTNPTPELLDTIESEFSLATVKKVATQAETFKGQLQNQQNEALYKQMESNARNYLETTVPKYEEEFKNEAFRKMFGEAFKAYGVNLEADKFVGLMRDFAEEVIKANGFSKKVADENKADTDEISGFGNNRSNGKLSGNLAEMSVDELDKVLDKYI